jgi:plastocyanin
MRIPPSLAILLVAVGAALPSCGGGGGGGYGGGSSGGNSNNPPLNTIYVGTGGAYGNETYMFSPPTLTVPAGTTVTFVWQGEGHSLESGSSCSPDGRFSSGGVRGNGYTMTHTFQTTGTYPFYCTTHCGLNMKGTITVQ